MADDARDRDAGLLREIAETINGASEMQGMLDVVLAKLLQLTGLKAGWIFLMDEGQSGDYRCAADACLPPALAIDGKRPMREGECWCIERYRNGRLNRAVNILNCKRLEEAVVLQRGDTGGLTHHATIPLRSGEDLFGILNVASPGKTEFSDEELALLQSVAYQIGTAAHRIRLYARERKRATLFERLGTAVQEMRKLTESDRLAAEVVRIAGGAFGWSNVALWMREPQGLVLRAYYEDGKLGVPAVGSREDARGLLDGMLGGRTERFFDPAEPELLPSRVPARSAVAVPMLLQGETVGALVVGNSPDGEPIDEVDAEVLKAVSGHVTITFENIRLKERDKTLARWEERNRIARDLHDSVSQMLFSLQLHARGLETALRDAPEKTRGGAREIGRLSREALAEMRGMIRQLRPAGLEEGLLTGLTRYGASIGLKVESEAGRPVSLPDGVETALWRIGQEALNNVRKHSGVEGCRISLEIGAGEVAMTVSDRGRGILASADGAGIGYGMTTMKERAEAAGGTATVCNAAEGGATVIVRLPLDAPPSGEEIGEP